MVVYAPSMQDNAQILGFTSGELSPWLATRYDLQAYQRGARRLENFLVQPYGGLRRRRGTRYVADAKIQSPSGVQLVPFCFSESDMLMLEFYPGGIRVYQDGKLLEKNGKIYEISTPWNSAEMVDSLRCMQVNDIVYVTTPFYKPIMLCRLSNTDWYYTALNMNPYPRETYLPQGEGLMIKSENDGNYALLETESSAPFFKEMEGMEYVIAEAPIETKTLFVNQGMSISSKALPNLSTSSVLKGTICHVANSSSGMNEYYTCVRHYFPENYNGSAHAKDYPQFFLPGVMRLNSNNEPYEVCGDWELCTNGEWNGLWEIWRSYDSLTTRLNFYEWDWTCIKTFGQDAYAPRQNWALTGSEDIPCRMVIVCRAYKGASVGSIMYFRIMGGSREYQFRISEHLADNKVKAKIMTVYTDSLPSFYTKKWSFGAFGARNGYPRFASMHQGRLWLGGASGLPTTLFGSTVGDYQNFRVKSSDDAALHLTLATDDQSRICWVCPMRNMLVGTSESEWTLAAPDGGNLTPTNASFSRQSAVGSENKVAYGVENSVFYVQRGGKRLREISYKLEADGYTSTDASILAEHLFAPGVKEWVVQRGDCVHLWALMNDGSLAVLTTNPEQQVVAWQRASFPGRKVLNMASIARAGSSEDEVWFVLLNEKSNQVSIERLMEHNEYVDGCCEFTPTSAGSVQVGLHLAGVNCMIYPKGKPELAREVEVDSNGCFDMDDLYEPGITYCIGAKYESIMQTMPFERENSFNSIQQHGRVKLRLHESDPHFAFKGEGAAQWEEFEPERTLLPDNYTGPVRISQIPSPGVGMGFCLRADRASDFALMSLTVEVDFHGK